MSHTQNMLITFSLVGWFGLFNATPISGNIQKAPTPGKIATAPPTLVAGQEWHDPVSGIDFVWVPPGKFMMGQTEIDKQFLLQVVSQEEYKNWYVNALPRHEVQSTQGFWMSKYEVTQEQWLSVMGGKNPASFNEEKVGKDWRKHPVEQVSWNDVQEFLKKLNAKAGKNPPPPLPGGEYRLPSETSASAW